jgi:predicted phosphodiesterase
VRTAILSDIHGNLEALEAVLETAAKCGVDRFIGLGDVLTYGPNPLECLDRVMEFSVYVLGDQDEAIMFDPEGLRPFAIQAIYWAREQLDAAPPADQNRYWEFLGDMPRMHMDGDVLHVHGSPREATKEKLYPEDIYNYRKLDALFAIVDRVCFQGHTHVPGVFTQDYQLISPEDCNYEYRLTGGKAMVNVGSVGQPRDGDRRACFVVTDGDVIRFHRVEYPVETTAEKIWANPDLDNRLGTRLFAGR